MWVHSFVLFPGSEAHKLFAGAPKVGALAGGKGFFVESVYELFCPFDTSEKI